MFSNFVRQLKREENGVALVFTLLVTAVLLILATGIVAVTGTDGDIAAARERQMVNRYAAEGAVEVIKEDICLAVDAGENPEDLEGDKKIDFGGSEIDFEYSVKTVVGNVYRITMDQPVKLEVDVQYTPGSKPHPWEKPGEEPGGEEDPGVEQPPVLPQPADLSVFNNLLFSNELLSFYYDINYPVTLDGPIFSNQSILIFHGVTVTGPIRAVESITIDQPDGFPGVDIQVVRPGLAVPQVNWDYLEQAAKVNNANTKVDFSQVTPFLPASKLADGDIVFVDGNLNITGDIPGSAIIAATGNIVIYGDCKNQQDAYTGFIAGGNVNIISTYNEEEQMETPHIKGFIVAGANLFPQGKAAFKGSLVAGGSFQYQSAVLDFVYSETVGGTTKYPTAEVFTRFAAHMPGIFTNNTDGSGGQQDPDTEGSAGGQTGGTGNGDPDNTDTGDNTDNNGQDGSNPSGEEVPSTIKVIRWKEL